MELSRALPQGDVTERRVAIGSLLVGHQGHAACFGAMPMAIDDAVTLMAIREKLTDRQIDA